MLETYLALMRGINVGGKNKLPMAELCALFVEAGGTNVRSFIQSGNVVFQSDPDVCPQIPDRVAVGIVERFGFRAPIVLRTREQLAEVVRDNPFILAGMAEETLHIAFLAEMPSPERVDELNPDRSPPDSFVVRGREIYLQLPNGMARTKLTNDYFDTKLKTISTVRNWRTVTKLLELMRESAP